MNIKSRNEFHKLIKKYRCKNGIEIGVQAGEFSEYLLQNTDMHVSMVDLWCKQDGYDDIANDRDHESLYQYVCNMAAKYPHRTYIFRGDSIEASKKIPSKFDFIYIDADHCYSAIKSDLIAWWKKLNDGGIFAGHDYLNTDFVWHNGEKVPTDIKVKRAVDEFVLENNLELHITDDGDCRSWYIIKGEKKKKKDYCIVTVSIGYRDIFQKCLQSQKKYADYIGADYIIQTKTKYPIPHFEKKCVVDYLKKYKRVLFLDEDIMVSNNAVNIFDVCDDAKKFYIYNESNVSDRNFTSIQTAHFFRYNKWPLNKNGNYKYFNTGVMLFSRGHEKILKHLDVDLWGKNDELKGFYEQSYLNYCIHTSGIKVCELNPTWNRMSHLGYGEERRDCFFIHYAGGWYMNGNNDSLRRIIELDYEAFYGDNKNK